MINEDQTLRVSSHFLCAKFVMWGHEAEYVIGSCLSLVTLVTLVTLMVTSGQDHSLLASDIYALFHPLFLFTSNHNIISHFSFPAVRFKTELPLTEPVPVQELVGTVKVQLRTERKPPNFCVRSFTTPQFNLLSLSQVGSGVVATINSWGAPTVAIVHWYLSKQIKNAQDFIFSTL